MKVKNKTKFVGARMTEAERNFIFREAADRGMRPSEYIRRILLAGYSLVDKISA